MSLSPSIQEPSRYYNRFSERFKSLEDSPPRENLTVASTLKNSPLRPTYKDEHKIFEGEKYISYEIPNEDCGEWRESEVLNNTIKDEVAQVSVSTNQKPKSPRQPQGQQQSPRQPAQQPKQQTSEQQPKPLSQPKQQVSEQQPKQQAFEQQPIEQEQRQSIQKVKKHSRSLPQYMQATASFHNKSHAKKESRQADNILRPRSQGGVTKRVGASKIPRLSTKNAIKQEINSPYVPMAARVKLFEKGLGNGLNTLTASTSKSTIKTKSSVSASSSSSQHSNPTSKVPRYAQQTSITMIRQELQRSEAQSAAVKRIQKSKKPKPFHFATNDRALHNHRSKQVLTENSNKTTTTNASRGSKRKLENTENSTHPNQKLKHN